ncbi:MAG: NUDIX hydrolase [Actinomycetaceae bacterium]|nr:NUDIX hydrolase [Arcanobacterium sp.]MDD7686494.1 NUDIX hydrolase [Actinomycetaceae bacterium]MDY5272774.1 NUDIX hydrolase [Arcanobacterium sp.]
MGDEQRGGYILRDEAAPEHVAVLDRRVEYHGAIFTVVDDAVEFAAGDQARRQYIRHDNAVGIVALRTGGAGEVDILLIRQYRHPVRQLLWEIPAGLLDHEGESGLAAAQRELAEETGLQASQWHQAVSYLSSPGCSTENLDIYIATGVSAVSDGAPGSDFVREAEEREIVSVWWPLEQVYQAVIRRDLRSPSLVLGVLAARNFLHDRVSP